jgi:hypothetical protein
MLELSGNVMRDAFNWLLRRSASCLFSAAFDESYVGVSVHDVVRLQDPKSPKLFRFGRRYPSAVVCD